MYHWVFPGVFTSLCFHILSTPNPSSIPFRWIWKEAVFGILFYLGIWWALASILYHLLLFLVDLTAIQVPYSLKILGQLAVGVLAPSACHFLHARSELTRESLEPSPKAFLVGALIFVCSLTTDYFRRKFLRAERGLGFYLPQEFGRGLVDHLFSHYLPDLAAFHANSHDEALGLYRTRSPGKKIKLMTRYWGAEQTREILEKVSQNPALLDSTPPSWPPEEPDRRRGQQKFPGPEKRNGYA